MTSVVASHKALALQISPNQRNYISPADGCPQHATAKELRRGSAPHPLQLYWVSDERRGLRKRRRALATGFLVVASGCSQPRRSTFRARMSVMLGLATPVTTDQRVEEAG